MKSFLLVSLLVFSPITLLGQGISGTWSSADTTGFSPRAGLSSCVLGDKIYIVGGSYRSNDSSVQVYTPSTNSWSRLVTIGPFQGGDGFAFAINGKIYFLVDQGIFHVLDTSTNQWTTLVTSGRFSPRTGYGASMIDNKIFVIGGDTGSYPNIAYLTTISMFDLTTNRWSEITPTGTFTPRDNPICDVVDGKIYAIGGYTFNFPNYVYSTTVEVIDPLTNSWTNIKTIGTYYTTIGGTSSCVLQGKIYFLGGTVSDIGETTNLVQIFDPTDNGWSAPVTSGAFTARSSLTTSVINSKIYAMGGADCDVIPNCILNTNEVFAPLLKVEERYQPDEITISPNPTTGIITISNVIENMLSITILNVLGQKVIENENPRSSTLTFDLSKYPPGVYYAQIIALNSATIRKIMLQ